MCKYYYDDDDDDDYDYDYYYYVSSADSCTQNSQLNYDLEQCYQDSSL